MAKKNQPGCPCCSGCNPECGSQEFSVSISGVAAAGWALGECQAVWEGSFNLGRVLGTCKWQYAWHDASRICTCTIGATIYTITYNYTLTLQQKTGDTNTWQLSLCATPIATGSPPGTCFSGAPPQCYCPGHAQPALLGKACCCGVFEYAAGSLLTCADLEAGMTLGYSSAASGATCTAHGCDLSGIMVNAALLP